MLDLSREIRVRWLTKEEAIGVLTSYPVYGLSLTTAVPEYPPSGSIFVYSKSQTKRWRRDGYDWKGNTDRHVRCVWSSGAAVFILLICLTSVSVQGGRGRGWG